MKSRISFFDKTVIRKDITRFMPLWLVYFVCGTLVMLMLTIETRPETLAQGLDICIGLFSCINMVYALLAAQLLFGDLYNSRLCNALHAMPLRRENWFLTHFTAGILFSLLPNLVLTVVFAFFLQQLWYTAFLWLGATMLSYLFFFGLATLTVMATGNRFAALTVYALLNFVSLEVYWVIYELIVPTLYGVRLPVDGFAAFSPVVWLLSVDTPLYSLTWMDASDVPAVIPPGYHRGDAYKLAGFGDQWGYLFLIAAVGLACAVGALLLYRRRKLECAGDFAAIRPVKWIVTIFGSIGCGMVFRVFAFWQEMLGMVLLFVGMAVAFFLLQMLLQRKVKVFEKKNWIRLAALLLAFALFLILGAADVLGVERRIPKAANVEKVLVSEGYMYDADLRAPENSGHSYILMEKPADIEVVRSAHEKMLQRQGYPQESRNITLCYYLKSGARVTRTYQVAANSEAYTMLKGSFRGQYLFGTSDVQKVVDGLLSMDWTYGDIERETASQIVKALWVDAENGRMGQNWDDHQGDAYSLWLNWKDEDGYHYKHLNIWSDAENTWPLLQQLAEEYTKADPEYFG